ncbi:MAG: thiamine phosphate synthase [Myxococcota bacterium]
MIPRLCYISDTERGTGGRDRIGVIEALFAGGLRMLVLRDRSATAATFRGWIRALAPLRARGLRVLVSRRLDLARAFDLDGVHLAADAVPLVVARRWLPEGTWIGYSAHSGAEAREAERAGATYVTLSPVYATGSKPKALGRGCDWLRDAAGSLGVPALALGGLRPERVPEVLEAGAWGVAAVSALGAAQDPAAAARAFLRALDPGGKGESK